MTEVKGQEVMVWHGRRMKSRGGWLSTRLWRWRYACFDLERVDGVGESERSGIWR